MSRFPREGNFNSGNFNSGNSNFNSPQRRPKPRPSGYAPQRFDARPPRSNKPPARAPKPKPPAGPARIAPLQPTSIKDRRRMLKAAAWRLAKIIHVRPAEVLKSLAAQPKLEVAFPGRTPHEQRGDATRLAIKIWRLNRP